jgi:TPR repeat protein
MRLPKLLLVLCLCIAAQPALAGPLEDGLVAYRKGDWTTALTLLRPLAEQGNAQAQERLGRLYERGKAVPRDYPQALEWHLKAAEQGDAAAQSHAGFLYRSGATGRQDYAEALKWYRRAAEQGNRLAQVGLGYMYAGAEGVELDGSARAPTRAMHWASSPWGRCTRSARACRATRSRP